MPGRRPGRTPGRTTGGGVTDAGGVTCGAGVDAPITVPTGCGGGLAGSSKSVVGALTGGGASVPFYVPEW